MTSEIENETENNYDMRQCMPSLATLIEAINLLVKKRLYLLKQSVSEIKSYTDAVGTTVTESAALLRKQNQFLSHENASNLFNQRKK